MTGMRWLILAIVFGSMGLVAFSGRDRTVDLANTFVANGQLRALDTIEEATLRRFLTALLDSEGAGTPIAINQRHQEGYLNIYVVDATIGAGAQVVSRGNAAYVSSSDILFVESSYFELGANRVFVPSSDELTEKVLSPLRTQAFFVLAHEIGHRQLRHGREWFGWEGRERSHAREIAADDFAISTMKKLYADPESRAAAGIPEPISTSLLDEPGPLERIADHLGYAVDFLADEIFDNPFPILTSSDTHPAFFGRMRALLQRLRVDAETVGDELALDRLELAEAVAMAGDALLASHPVEIEYSNPFQYAYLTADAVLVVGNDGAPVVKTNLGDLVPGELHRQSLPPPQHDATVRYAWPGGQNETLSLRRDGRLERIDNETGDRSLLVDLRGKLGDSTCVKQFLLPALQRHVLATSCIGDRPQVTRIHVDGTVRTISQVDLALAASQAAGDASMTAGDIDVRGLELAASGLPNLVYVAKGAVYFTNLSGALEPSPARKLALEVQDLPESMEIRGARLLPRTILADGSGHPFFAYGAPVFRDIGIFDAEVRSDVPIASVDLSPSVDENRLDTILPFVSTFPVSGDRLIVNFNQEGAYLIDFAAKSILPIRRSGFSPREQIVANGLDDWIYYRKYGNRILVFKKVNHAEP